MNNSKDIIIRISLIIMLSQLSGAIPTLLMAQTKENSASYEVFVVQESWHTGIIFNTKDVDPDIWPEIELYRDRKYVDVGWGDEKFYQAFGSPVLLAARAIFIPTRSALQIFPFNLEIRAASVSGSRILRIPVDRNQLDALSRFISDSYMRDEDGKAQPSRVNGETDKFFIATQKYHLFRTCNTWVAKGFSQSGFENVRVFCVLNANQLFRQLANIPGSEFLNQ